MPHETDIRVVNFRAVAFDLDGTLIDTMEDLTAAVNVMLTTLGLPALAADKIRTLVGDGVETLVTRALDESLAGHKTHAVQRSAALTLFRRLYARDVFKHSRVYPGVLDTLHALRNAGVTLACITNKNSEFAQPVLQQAGLADCFSFTLCADQAEDRKPSPRLLLAACARLAISPQEMLYVGDSGVDIAAARAAGCSVVAVSYGYGNCSSPAFSEADRIIGAMEQLMAGGPQPS